MKVLINSELSQELTRFLEANPGLIMKAFSEYLKQNPEVMQEELQRMSESLEYTQIEQAKDRRRIRNLEILLGLIEKKEIEDFEENQEELKEIFSRSVLAKIKPVKTETEMLKLLYDELEKVPSMRNKDVLNFLKLRKTNTSKATRLMRLMPEMYKDVTCEQVPGSNRILRIYRKSYLTL